MTAALALKSARAFGIHVRVDGDNWELEAPEQPPQAVLDLLSLHKAGILKLLRPNNDGWSVWGWRFGAPIRWHRHCSPLSILPMRSLSGAVFFNST